MEVLINELSLHKQFATIEDFINYSLSEFVKIFSFLSEIDNYPLKKYDFYNCYITNTSTFHNLLTNKDLNRISDYVRKYKTIIDRVISEPYWETNRIHSVTPYIWNNRFVTDSSIAESFERESCLLSFTPSIFEVDYLDVEKFRLREENEKKTISNFYQVQGILNYLYKERKISFYQYCRNYFKNSKLNFEFINKGKSFDLVLNRNDENEFLNSFNLFCEMSWQEIISQGGKGDRQVGLAFSIYHNQQAFRGYNLKETINKFRCTQKYRVFGFRRGEQFFVLEFDLTHRLSE